MINMVQFFPQQKALIVPSGQRAGLVIQRPRVQVLP